MGFLIPCKFDKNDCFASVSDKSVVTLCKLLTSCDFYDKNGHVKMCPFYKPEENNEKEGKK